MTIMKPCLRDMTRAACVVRGRDGQRVVAHNQRVQDIIEGAVLGPRPKVHVGLRTPLAPSEYGVEGHVRHERQPGRDDAALPLHPWCELRQRVALAVARGRARRRRVRHGRGAAQLLGD
jgi:hypothetical protein